MGFSLFNTSSTTLWVILVVVVVVVEAATSTSLGQLSLPGCPSKCGNVDIPYPFGIGEGCHYHNMAGDVKDYKITCNDTYNPPRPMVYDTIEVVSISLEEGTSHIRNYVAYDCYTENGTQYWHNTTWLTMGSSSFFAISSSKNVFAAIGCDTYAWFKGTRHGQAYKTGCMTSCNYPQEVVNGTCSGIGCCETSVPDGVTNITITPQSFDSHVSVIKFNPCSYAFVVAKDAFNFSLANLSIVPHQIENQLPVIFDWMIGTENCKIAKANGNCLCNGSTSICEDSAVQFGYRCKCLKGYSGNPYLKDGCQDVNECAHQEHNDCEKPEDCINTIGNFTCQCPKGFHGAGKKSDRCVPDEMTFSTIKKIIIIGSFSAMIITTFVPAFVRNWQYEKNQRIKERERFFRQNGGHLLHQRLRSTRGEILVEMFRIFKIEELEKATNKYSDGNIIGKGGFGVVYKGVLAKNQVVAIKRSLKVDPKQSDQFINEVIVVSQLNHRNVVKLLGGCLETEVPLLVYEYIDNGTLYDHLHDERKASDLRWNIRLKIAVEVAEVLSYLHTTISIPIIHRDMKSMNILLDTNYTAKVSDFGASRLVPIDEDQLATVVLGTRGYLDPEYLQTNELTRKSDVYSFGVVLVELLTRQTPFSYLRPENEKFLAIFFLRKLNDDCLSQILDDKIQWDDVVFEQAKEVANLASRCLKLKGEERPTMKEVAMELQKITMTRSYLWSKSSGVVFQEESSVSFHDTTMVDNEMSHTGGNNLESLNSQVISLLAGSFHNGR